MTIGQRIKKRRELLNIGQTELAEKVDVSKQTLYKYENDIVTNIPSDKVELMAKALGCSPSYLMGWEDENGELTLLGQLGASYKKRMFPDDASNPEADHLFELYQEAPPEIQAAIDTLLGYKKPDA